MDVLAISFLPMGVQIAILEEYLKVGAEKIQKWIANLLKLLPTLQMRSRGTNGINVPRY